MAASPLVSPSKRSFSPWVIGITCGITIASLWLGGGYDAYYVFFSDHIQTVPAWVHLFLKPLTLLPWPYSYGLLSGITVLAVYWITVNLGGNWWLTVLSLPVLWEVWSGQVEWLVAIGILLGVRVMEGKARPIWMGLAWVLMLSKPWVGWGPTALLTFYLLRELGWKKLLPAGGLSAAVILATLIFWPTWILEQTSKLTHIIYHTAATNEGQEVIGNGALAWPWRLLFVLAIPGPMDRRSVLRRVVAATLILSPYLRVYHVMVLLVLLEDTWESILIFVAGWAILLSAAVGYLWGSLAWTLPVGVLIYELFRLKSFARAADNLKNLKMLKYIGNRNGGS